MESLLESDKTDIEMDLEDSESPERELQQMPKHIVLPLIIRHVILSSFQLQFYGLNSVASNLSELTNTPNKNLPSSELAELLHLGSAAKEFDYEEEVQVVTTAVDDDDDDEIEGLILDTSKSTVSKQPPQYTTHFVTHHHSACLTASFSLDGKYIATGSADKSIKLVDVSRIKLMKSDGESGIKPVIRTYYGNSSPITDVQFHPNNRILASCSSPELGSGMSTSYIHLYDLHSTSKNNVKSIKCADSVVASFAFHPSGDFLVAGGDNGIRMWDVKRGILVGGVPGVEGENINCVRYATQGNVFAACTSSGNISFHDTLSGTTLNTIKKAHSGYSVSTIKFSKNGRYLLSVGRDSKGRLWDLNIGKCVREYEGATIKNNNVGITFASNEDFVVSSDETNGTVVCWDTRTGDLLRKFTGHTDKIRTIASSPTDSAFMTCCDDFRAPMHTRSLLKKNKKI
ncbi:hypothetical protein HK096_000313 [Nowakowskiella sp. JEL0078]|nr:hypothetical protein HK096_000313 [Nowakowskiella sp. JEL0078]